MRQDVPAAHIPMTSHEVLLSMLTRKAQVVQRGFVNAILEIQRALMPEVAFV